MFLGGPWLLPGGNQWETLAIGGGWEEERTWGISSLPPSTLRGVFVFFPPAPPMAASPLQFQLLPYDPGSWAMVIPLPPSVFLDLGTIVAFCYGQSRWSCHPLLASDLHPTYNQFPELPFI